MSERPETGPMQFGDDWPGIFIRGDNAAGFAYWLRTVMRASSGAGIAVSILDGLASDLESCNVRTLGEVQIMKPFDDCVVKP